MYAVFGPVQFDLITYFEGLDGRWAADYAEHPLIGRKPRLQHVGDALDELRLQLLFHAAYCDPGAELEKLKALVRSAEARQFVMGDGAYKGWYVMTECESLTRQTDERGTLLVVEASAMLREYVEPQTVETRQAQSRAAAASRTAAAPKSAMPVPPVLDARDGWARNGNRAPT